MAELLVVGWIKTINHTRSRAIYNGVLMVISVLGIYPSGKAIEHCLVFLKMLRWRGQHLSLLCRLI